MKQLFDYQICLMQILYQTAVISSAEVHVFYYAIAYCTSPKRYFILHPNFILPICFISHSSLLMFWLELCTHPIHNMTAIEAVQMHVSYTVLLGAVAIYKLAIIMSSLTTTFCTSVLCHPTRAPALIAENSVARI